MKKLLLILLCLAPILTKAQAPTIEGDTMLCPYTDGTASITNDMEYDTYQWYSKYWFTSDDFEPIDGATGASFTYDWYTYDQSLFKVVVTLDGETYESNTITIDSYAWAGLIVMTETSDDVTFNPDQGYYICEGSTITNTIQLPYNVVQWYKDGVAIEGATDPTYTITTAGTYHAVAAPDFCPNSTTNTLPIVVINNPDCGPVDPTPIIDGTAMQCPQSTSSVEVTNIMEYDSYQWYFKYFLEEEFQLIEGATEAEFTYDTYTYDAGEFKMTVTLDGETYESAPFTIDTYNWAGLISINELSDDVIFDPDFGYLICEESTITCTIQSPYTIAQWYKDGEAIEGATDVSYTITTPGVYYVTAAPSFCPDNTASLDPFTVSMNPECNLGINDPEFNNSVTLYPNPTSDILNVMLPNNTEAKDYTIFDVTGKTLLQGVFSTTNSIDVSSLTVGTYIIKLTAENKQFSQIFIRK